MLYDCFFRTDCISSDLDCCGSVRDVESFAADYSAAASGLVALHLMVGFETVDFSVTSLFSAGTRFRNDPFFDRNCNFAVRELSAGRRDVSLPFC